jgi:hypothetical protein
VQEVTGSNPVAPIDIKPRVDTTCVPADVRQSGLTLVSNGTFMSLWLLGKVRTMPRLTFKLPKYSLHKSSGNAKVRFNGKATYLGKYKSPESKKAYDEFIANLPKQGEVTRVAAPAPGVVSLIGEDTLRYQAHAETYYVRDGAPTGEHVTIRRALVPLNQRFAELPVSEFTPDKLEQVQEDMIKLGRSRNCINKSCNIIRRCFKWAVRKGLFSAVRQAELQTSVPTPHKNRLCPGYLQNRNLSGKRLCDHTPEARHGVK